jgi:DNA adenine methylase
VPVGSYKKPAILDESNLRAASKALQATKLCSADFSETLDHAKENDFFYFDPPYYLRRIGFTSYAVHQFGGPLGGADFGADEHDRLMRVARLLVQRGCHVVISNSDAPYVRTLFNGFQIHSATARRYINCDGDRRSPVDEIVITES